MGKDTHKFLVKPDSKLKLKKYDPANIDGFKDEHDAKGVMQSDIKKLIKLQEKLYANDRYSLLIILQAMDAAGKDGVIKHVMNGINPQGCKVTSFRHPSDEEYRHDYFWRYNKALPESGQIGIFNRSHYEHVLICRVHPKFILNEKLPKYDTIEKLDNDFWEHRFRQINRFEKNLVESGTIVLKFFLHLSKKEQRKRLLERIEEKNKNWKFSFADIDERQYWDEYHKCYEKAIEATSTKEAPWYIIPADNKWYTRVAIANILVEQLEKLHLKYPDVSSEEKQKLERAKSLLLKE